MDGLLPKSDKRYFYHSFPRPHANETRDETVGRGLAILQSMAQLGLILAPEIVEWHAPAGGSLGSPSPIRLLQQRICFTELSRPEVDEHSRRFGSFALEFEIETLRRIGALPVIYMPQALSEHDHLALIGLFVVSHLGHIDYTLKQLHFLGQHRDPAFIQKTYPGATRLDENAMFNLGNTDQSGGIVQESQVPWSAIRNLLDFVGFRNAPFHAMTGVTSILQSLFYPTDDDHVDERLGYYRQREWRVAAGYDVNGIPRGQTLEDKRSRTLLEIDERFWGHQLDIGTEAFRRVDKALTLSCPNPQELVNMISRLIVPPEVVAEARSVFPGVEVTGVSSGREVDAVT